MSDPMLEGYDTKPTWTQRQVDTYLTAARQAGRDEERARLLSVVMQSNPAAYSQFGRAGAGMMREAIIRELSSTVSPT